MKITWFDLIEILVLVLGVTVISMLPYHANGKTKEMAVCDYTNTAVDASQLIDENLMPDIGSTLVITCDKGDIEIDLETGRATLSEGLPVDEASRLFWDMVEREFMYRKIKDDSITTPQP